MSVYSYRDTRNHLVELYYEHPAVAINTVQPIRGAHTGSAHRDNTYHEVYVPRDDLDRLINALITMRDQIDEWTEHGTPEPTIKEN